MCKLKFLADNDLSTCCCSVQFLKVSRGTQNGALRYTAPSSLVSYIGPLISCSPFLEQIRPFGRFRSYTGRWISKQICYFLTHCVTFKLTQVSSSCSNLCHSGCTRIGADTDRGNKKWRREPGCAPECGYGAQLRVSIRPQGGTTEVTTCIPTYKASYSTGLELRPFLSHPFNRSNLLLSCHSVVKLTKHNVCPNQSYGNWRACAVQSTVCPCWGISRWMACTEMTDIYWEIHTENISRP